MKDLFMPYEALTREAVALAARLLHEAQRHITRQEKRQAAKIAGLLTDPHGKTLTMAMVDQAFRSHTPARIADQIGYLLGVYGMPRYFAWWERVALGIGSWLGHYLPRLIVPLIVAKLRHETQHLIVPAEEDRFRAYLHKRRQSGMRLNINQLGEAILGEEEARRRLQAYLTLLSRPDVEYISVKISSIFSQINLVAFEHTVAAIKDRLRALYRQAMQHTYVWPDGRCVPKFVNLDMEEYRDLHLTVAAFTQVLDEPEFLTHRAGIVLQAYLPDSATVQRELTAWALRRVERGGAPIKVRLVKGANLALERVEAAWHSWPQAPYQSKAEVDANYKRMVTYGMRPEHARAVHLGIASHNLFDVAYAMLLRNHYGLQDAVEFEMLEGMANHQARAVQATAGGVLLYAPVVKRADFHSAIAYFVRRLDENTAPENFLYDLFGLVVGSPSWHKQQALFLHALKHVDTVSEQPQRRQNRQMEARHFDPYSPFCHEPETDWSLPHHEAWIRAVRDTWQQAEIAPIPLQIGGELLPPDCQNTRLDAGYDPSRPETVAYRYTLATREHIEPALDVAQRAKTTWVQTPISTRKALLVACAEHLARSRGDLIGVMMLDGGKRVTEADPEVSEAIDYANYYARSLDLAVTELADCTYEPFGVVLVTPPWNFPLAIPCGGILAALMAGNVVILKPAPEAVLVGWKLCQVLWEAGIPKEVLQFVPTTDDAVGQGLVTDDRVNAVILTGAYTTGRLFQTWKPDLRLFAETSGKNSMIITALADHDQAIKDVVQSAFGHNGQKCSAASVAVLEAEVYDNPTFLRQLRDAAASLKVGSQWDLRSSITPLIREPEEALSRALKQLDEGESWLLEPRMVDGNPQFWSPGIKLGVKPGSWYHSTECFGPVLGLIRAGNLAEAVDIVNAGEFGLTSGLHSLDEREIAWWKAHIAVGNGYINRGTTGAIAQRQPFGGWKKSVFGYAKAGGPNYVLSLGRWHDRAAAAAQDWQASYRLAWQSHFGVEHDPSQILGESNVFRYRPIQSLTLRFTADDHPTQALMVACASQVCGVPLTLSIVPGATRVDVAGDGHVTTAVESDADLIHRIERGEIERLRVLSPVSLAVRQAANAHHVHIVDVPVVHNGRLELRHYLREQSIAHTTHRYGTIMQPSR